MLHQICLAVVFCCVVLGLPSPEIKSAQIVNVGATGGPAVERHSLPIEGGKMVVGGWSLDCTPHEEYTATNVTCVYEMPKVPLNKKDAFLGFFIEDDTVTYAFTYLPYKAGRVIFDTRGVGPGHYFIDLVQKGYVVLEEPYTILEKKKP
ncbi:MAG: hypothetical protein SGCHY_004731 [Lobulomycetales sp.]